MIKYINFNLDKMTLTYMLDEKSRHISMFLLPTNMKSCFEERKELLQHRHIIFRAWDVGSLCHLSLRHHAQGNGAGGTLKYGESTDKLKYVNQEKLKTDNGINIITYLKADEGYEIKHTVKYKKGRDGIEVETVFRNETGKDVSLDMLSSFSLDNLSPLQKDGAPYKLKLHRFRGGWSLEGKHQEDTIEQLNLEGSWFRAFPESERYGVLGSRSVGRWFPFGCVEDKEYNVFWAVQLACNSSWQMELSRDGDCYSLSGGIADCEFGSWWKIVSNGEYFIAPKAYISVSNQSLEDVCQNITDIFLDNVNKQPFCEQNLPIIFNDWCTTWGSPTHDNTIVLADKINKLPISYLVIDAGWSTKPVGEKEPQGGNGDWECDLMKFPNGLKSLSRTLNEMGIKLGIWMEFEVTTRGANIHSGEFDSWHLFRNLEIIQTGPMRRFLDFRNPDVISYLTDKVISFLMENEISYLKVDCNGSIGFGCDGAESKGEGLRQQMQGVYLFFEKMRNAMPQLVIENCASGGHRLEPNMMGITAMSSFSDAHECQEIPYIAANLHQLILPRQSQIWAVISPELSIREIQYRLVSTMLGRFCLSGEIAKLTEIQWNEVKKATVFYEKVKGIIKEGRSTLLRNSTNNQHHLEGSQVLLRTKKDEKILIVYHSFENPVKELVGSLPAGNWIIDSSFGAKPDFTIENNFYKIIPNHAWEGFALYLTNNY